ncbi:MAG: hypothetical protein U0929_17410 [Planctomycetaceae bacterium]
MGRSLYLIAICFIVLIAVFGECVAGDSPFPIGESGEKIRSFVDGIPPDVSPLSMNDKNISLLIQYRRTLEGVTHLRGERLRFIGFFEGTTRVDIPEWWERRLLARQVFGDQVFFPSEEAENGESLWKMTDEEAISGIDRVALQENGVRIGRGTIEYEVPDSIMQRVYGDRVKGKLPAPLAASLNDKRVALFNEGGGLACVDRETSTIAWIHELKDIPSVGGGSGPDDIYYEVMFSNGKVAAFYAWNYEMTCLIVDEISGQLLFRFNTQYVRIPAAKPK